MKVIGFGGSGHDWSCCILHDGKVVCAIAEERLTRSKYGLGGQLIRSAARQSCLEQASATAADIDIAVACDLVPITLAMPFRHRLVRIRHHLAHAYAAFFASPFPSAAIMIVDNAGSPSNGGTDFEGTCRQVETLSYWHGKSRNITELSTVSGDHILEVNRKADYYQVGETNNSLGHLYWTASCELGFVYRSHTGDVSEDGKTMGLAAYGDDRYVAELSEHMHLREEGVIEIALSNGDFRNHLRHLLGTENQADRDIRRAGVARAVQVMLETALIHAARHAHRRTGERYLTVAGGVALNCLANARVVAESGFDNFFVFPAPADDGNALGAAFFGLIEQGGYQGPIDVFHQLPFLGPMHHEQAFQTARTQAAQWGFQESRPQNLIQAVADELAAGKIVAWYEGRSEFGPRALGHRSILADPRGPNTKDRINKLIKHREPFRPFSPMVTRERVHDFFLLPDVYATAFMGVVGMVRTAWRQYLPAVTHVDGSARVQTIEAERYGNMHKLLTAFEERSGFPILLNTSFNRAGEPIVETPLDALECFKASELDLLVLGGRIYSRTVKNES